MIRGKISTNRMKHLQTLCYCYRMTTPSKSISSARKRFENNVEGLAALSSGQKRPVLAVALSSQKKVKGKASEMQRPPFWLGFHALNCLAIEQKCPKEPSYSASELVRYGMTHEDALEWVEAIPSFPYVLQDE